MASINKREMIERYIKAYNSFDIDLMLSCLHPDVRFKNISNGEINAQTVGKSEFESLARQSATLFKTRTQTVKSFEMAGDKVTVEIDFYAMLAKALSNDIKAGDKLALQGRSEFIFKDDLIGSIIDES
jgi:ketosteroid isomerase-like protein